MNLTGASAVVTGGASGLGLATARALARASVRVVVLDLPASAGAQVADELGAVDDRAQRTEPLCFVQRRAHRRGVRDVGGCKPRRRAELVRDLRAG